MNKVSGNNTKKITLSIIIPTYNEAVRIVSTLEKINTYLKTKEYACEIIVVDDGSHDNTVAIVEEFSRCNALPLRVLTNSNNQGKGFAVKRGVLASEGEYVLFTDADLSTPIEEIEKIFPYFQNGYEIVIGSRALKDSRLLIRQPWYREKLGKLYNFFVQLFVMRGIKDTQCGFKMFEAGMAKEIFSKATIDRFAFDVEALIIAKARGIKIKSVPVIWRNSPQSRVHLLTDALRMLIDLFRIALCSLRGKYRHMP